MTNPKAIALMSFTTYQGHILITEPGGEPQLYERFLLTANPDGSRSLRTVTQSPKGDLLRDVNQMVAANWRPIETIGRLFYKNEAHGSVLRRVVGDTLHSYVWNQNTEVDYATFDAPPHMSIGYHAIILDSWKMCFIDQSNPDFQEILVHSVSNTWNGKTLGHGQKIPSRARYDGQETLDLPAGTYDCERYVWETSFGKELHVWSTGPHRMLARMLVVSGDKEGSIYELGEMTERETVWP